jgi:hypothetical protein
MWSAADGGLILLFICVPLCFGSQAVAARHGIGRSHPDKAAKILNGRYQKELFGIAAKAAQFQPGEAEMPHSYHRPDAHRPHPLPANRRT